jgi:hypothetical protein
MFQTTNQTSNIYRLMDGFMGVIYYSSLWGYQCGEHDQDRQNIIGGMHGCSCPNKMIVIGHEPSQCTVDMDETCFLLGMIYIYI